MSTDYKPEGGFTIVRPFNKQPRPYKCGQEFGFLLMSDLHIGSADVDYRKIKVELEEAKILGDRILINGDILDAIIPKDHKRYTPGAVHPRLANRSDVLDGAIEWAVEILAPYASLVDMIGTGNHETVIEKYHGTDPVRRLVQMLKTCNSQVEYGGMTGFIEYRFAYESKKGHGGNGRRFVIWYHHGSGGASPVTKGTIDFHRRGWVRSDIKWLGHKHNRLNFHEVCLECPEQGDEPKRVEVRCVMTGSYFKTYLGQSQESLMKNGRRSSYASDWGLAPQGMGGARVVLKILRDGEEVKVIQ